VAFRIEEDVGWLNRNNRNKMFEQTISGGRERFDFEIANLHITVEQIAGVNEFEGTKTLIHNVALVDIFQNVGTNHSVEVSL
jgi:hypothetical protein